MSAENGGPSREGWGTPWLAEACLASDDQLRASNSRTILLLLGCIWLPAAAAWEPLTKKRVARHVLDWIGERGRSRSGVRGAIKVRSRQRFLGNVTEQRQNPRYLRVLVSRRRGQVDHDFRDEQTGAKPGPRPPFLGRFWGFVQVPGPPHRYSVLFSCRGPTEVVALVGRSSQLARIKLERLPSRSADTCCIFQKRQDGEGGEEGERTGKWENGVGRKPPTLSTPSTLSTRCHLTHLLSLVS